VDLLKGMDGIAAWLDRRADAGSLLLTLGAGDIGRQVEGVCRHLAARGAQRNEGRS
jgi:UDP-N-acetylmuramate-alanine ligase